MPRDLKYGRITTEFGDIPDDEPVIVFRARDRLVPKLLAYYRLFCWKAGSPKRHLMIIDRNIELFTDWQADNPSRIPDSERSREWDIEI